MLHVSLMPSWKGLEPLYLVSHGSFTNLKKEIIIQFWLRDFRFEPAETCYYFAGAASLFAIQKVLQRKLPYALQWNLLVSIGGK